MKQPNPVLAGNVKKTTCFEKHVGSNVTWSFCCSERGQPKTGEHPSPTAAKLLLDFEAEATTTDFVILSHRRSV